MSFSNLGLSLPILNAIKELGYSSPTPIQKEAIPHILDGRDLLAAAQTGSGKTASFVLPILEQLKSKGDIRAKRVHALILTPTRELAIQVEKNISQYAKYLGLSSLAMFGGVDLEPQKQGLIDGIHILVATPGRLIDMMYQRAVHFDELEVLVIDEADRMLDLGFIGDLKKIISRLPEQRQSLLFSATLSDQIRNVFDVTKENAVEISVSPKTKTASGIKHWLITVDKDTKSALLSHLITDQQWDQALIFIEKKHAAAKLASQLEKRGIKAEAIHSGRSQASREKVLADFKSGSLKFLIATGVAARGIDIDDLSRVVNYDLPFQPDEYIHRVGRTGRAGKSGEALSLVDMSDFKKLCAIESQIGHLIDRVEIDGFPVRKTVPISKLNFVPKNKTNNKKKPAKADGKTRRSKHDKSAQKSKPNKNEGNAKKRSSGDSINRHIWGKK